MPRANRHFLPGQIWHITHRCHKQEFLLRFAKDRACWLYWLLQARQRFDLCVLNYIVTSNHVHLLVKDCGKNVIPGSMQLIAGRTAQAYNQRKSRRGAFWEDRYHATAVQSDNHLFRCLIYIDLNMVRAGIVRHPRQWPHSGYHEIQQPPKRCRIIDHDALLDLCGLRSLTALRSAHTDWIATELKREASMQRDPRWTESIAVGQRKFVENIRQRLGRRVTGRKCIELDQGFQLKEASAPYGSNRP